MDEWDAVSLDEGWYRPGLGDPIRFWSGEIVATPGVIDLAAGSGVELGVLLARHLRGDWGDLDWEDWVANDRALETGERVLSTYRVSATAHVWIITAPAVAGSGATTTLLLPSEY